MSVSDDLSRSARRWITIETDPDLLAFEIERTEAQIALYDGDVRAQDYDACGGSEEICRASRAVQEESLRLLLKQSQRLSRSALFREARPSGPLDISTLRERFERANRVETAELLELISGSWPRLGPRDESWLCCPLPGHDDKTPSFHMNDDGRWHCFGCGRGGGDKVSFVAAYLESSQMAGLLYLEERFGR